MQDLGFSGYQTLIPLIPVRSPEPHACAHLRLHVHNRARGQHLRYGALLVLARILGRHMAPFSLFTFPYSSPRPAWCYPNILVLVESALAGLGALGHLRIGLHLHERLHLQYKRVLEQ